MINYALQNHSFDIKNNILFRILFDLISTKEGSRRLVSLQCEYFPNYLRKSKMKNYT